MENASLSRKKGLYFVDCLEFDQLPGAVQLQRETHQLRGNVCEQCGKTYKRACSLIRHKKYECGQPPRYACSHCPYMAKYRTHLLTHIAHRHKVKGFELEPGDLGSSS
ncbi:PREDICTED: zinc finger and SCAN domain-containing protein 26-like [Ceratosolen solmsi marchali]|uniref:Zinc finger and SCAN domain-containing protein 26-like n=1 Tax=Ceratosolen solmsi marchali TaxID=326594 RepID=A0AAJ6YX17_9HYME|nr:PREDICTED: zinc finger and SCAN domain-containing protein 26-like [Ceratosolen solmsi marchali]